MPIFSAYIDYHTIIMQQENTGITS